MLENILDYLRIALYTILFILAFFLYQTWEREHPKVEVSAASAAVQLPAASHFAPTIPQMDRTQGQIAAPLAVTAATTRSASIQQPASIVTVTTDILEVEIDTRGGDIISVKLLDYPEALNSPSPFWLLNNQDKTRYIAESGLLSEMGPDTASEQGLYTSAQTNYVLGENDKELTVFLNWQKNGVMITKQYTFVRDSYEIKVAYNINNQSNKNWQGNFYTQLMRTNAPPTSQGGFVNLATYFGAAVSSPKQPFEKITFKQMQEKAFTQSIQGGWAAMIQHYFISAWVPPKQAESTYYTKAMANGLYAIGMIGKSLVVAPGAKTSTEAQLYTGPAIADKLEKTAPGLKLTIDYGWFWFISDIIFWMMLKIYHLIGNWGWSIVLVTIIIKLLFYSLSAKSYRSMSALKKLQPRIEALKERYGDDRQKLTQATLELYKQEKVNPMSGCLPIVIQIPVFIALYWVLVESVELRQAPFILWIHDLSQQDPYYVLPLLMGISMFIQQRLNPPPADPVQAKVMMAMPIIFTVLFANFPAGLMLYWFVNNTLSFLQQWYIMRQVNADTDGKQTLITKKNKDGIDDGIDTIVAQATPAGRGGIAVLRISGPLVRDIMPALLGRAILPPRAAVYSPFLDAMNQPIDEGIAIFFPAPHSFTGEDVVELHGHGSPIVVDLLLQRITQLGARLARAGEFSERAFLNNKMDLTQAEAIADLIDAASTQAARLAMRSLQGEFSHAVQAINEKVIALRIYVEASIDFSDEAIPFLTDQRIKNDLDNISHDLHHIERQATQGALLREGMTVVIAGQPNVGKSSLLNVLSGQETAIVTAIPGTTRDVLREVILIDGIPLHIIDTAGLRESEDIVEQEGIKRAKRVINEADIILHVSDVTQDEINNIGDHFPDRPIIFIRNKIDLIPDFVPRIEKKVQKNNGDTIVFLSAQSGAGIDLLKQCLMSYIGLDHQEEGLFLARRRHLDALLRAKEYVNQGLQQIEQLSPMELLAEDLRLAQQALSEITGEWRADDLLGRIFSSFCIGK